MITLEYNKSTIYPKVETIFNRNEKFKVDTSSWTNPVFELIKRWDVTEKIDGMNTRIFWKDKTLSFAGRNENSQVPKEMGSWLEENIHSEYFLSIFGEKNVTLYGECFGGKIQLGKNYSQTSKFILFDVRVGNFWLTRNEMVEIADQLKIETVPYLGEMTNEEIIELVRVGFPSKIGTVPICEGIIAKPHTSLYDGEGNRVMYKIKHKDF